ncbi:citrate lyase subunit beta/citryl-CoA lyase [Saccharomonospora amisosensis]|uniref:Citrate lyase subunit beta/citryl-CoA lyase n=1 Tax=Saccharomonospora amisosensis TaxID=1128677 RepID=A0A7X5ZTN9_9PSEU|nr:CoA ester lyase [Saccharomonospora amisosensis]NIJ14816.1 citrate lyase subunit beta/citryl-CoA lyase [Saccharomonospora amisosensis]
MTRLLRSARTLLFVPGDRPDRFAKAVATGADAVVVDLEDAVAPESKERARAAAAEWLSAGNADTLVRINAHGTPWFADDLAMVIEANAAVMLPKAQDAEVLAALGAAGVVPLVETAAGIQRAREVCTAPGVVRVAFGSVDLAAELGVAHDDHLALTYARSALVVASAAAGLPGPIDGVTTALHDTDALLADLRHARRLGFTGKLCVHPSQVTPLHDSLKPTPSELDWAKRVLAAAADGAAAQVDGQLVDKPVVERARGLIEREG